MIMTKNIMQIKVNGIKLLIYGNVNNQLIQLCFDKHNAKVIVTHTTYMV